MKKKSAFFASLFLLGYPAILQAQDSHHPKPAAETAAPAVSAPGMMAMMPGMMAMMQDMSNPTRHVEGRIAFLHAELAITAEQEPAWKTLADALRQNATGLSQVMPSGNMNGDQVSVLDQLLGQQRGLEARLEGLRAINAALKPLADALTEDQRRTLNELFPHVAGLQEMQGMMSMGGTTSAATDMSGMAQPAP